jgi:L-alanine-DL-glutamate epimerase-like enolase superfamily enzyme
MIKRLNRAGARGFLNTEGTNVDPHKAWRLMMANEKPGGHGERSVAVGTVDMAMWDLAAKLEGKPLYKLLAERYHDGISDDRVYVYAAGGYYYPEKGIEGLTEEMQSYLDLGYDTIKIKIGGASLSDDCRRVEAVLALLGPGQTLAVDANGRFDLSMALKYAQALNQYDLKWFEEPGDPLDFKLLAEVANVSRNPLATGENLFSTQDARNLIRYGGLRIDRDILQIDPALSCGLVEYLRYLKMLKDNGWNSRSCIPHGGTSFLCIWLQGWDWGATNRIQAYSPRLWDSPTMPILRRDGLVLSNSTSIHSDGLHLSNLSLSSISFFKPRNYKRLRTPNGHSQFGPFLLSCDCRSYYKAIEII